MPPPTDALGSAEWGRGRAAPERIKRESVNWSGLVWSLGCWSWSSSPSSSSRSRARETPVPNKDRKGWAPCLSRRMGELEGHHPPARTARVAHQCLGSARLSLVPGSTRRPREVDRSEIDPGLQLVLSL